ncbi:MAG: iron-sulfur cluster assembly accessory protein [Gammaproteobacteria bacterium]|nr:iron-sulfur cluster assembly accessory protein [Gammaproteobacteria bacterium]NNJ85322.1 iron-sulfur cluster assembly accessory protein [Gammaproteobacteria bacterium]
MPEYGVTINEEEFKITPPAREQLAKIFEQSHAEYEEIEAIRVFVAGGGCSGMTYGMTFTDKQTEYDHVLDDNGLKIYVDAVALNYLRGVEIDYVQRPSGPSFVFNNVFALAGGAGGCGDSGSCCSSSAGGCGSGCG